VEDQSLLDRPTPERLLAIFLTFFVLGTLATVLPPIDSSLSFPLSTAVAILYGLLLVYSQKRYYVAFSSTAKTSPYVLGFLFTLIALLNTFLRSGSTTMSTNEYMTFAKWQMGAAIGTSVAGLVMRQVLVTLDPGEQSASSIYEELLDQIKSHWGTFADAQKGLIETIRAFVATREDLFHKEEAAASLYIRRLGTLLESLNKTQQSFDTLLDSLGTTLGDHTSTIGTRLASLETILATRQQTIAESLTQFEQALSKHSRNVSNDCEATSKSLDNLLKDLVSKAESAVRSFQGPIKESHDSVKLLAEEVSTLSAGWRQVSQGIAGASEELRTEMTGVLSHLRESGEELEKIQDRIKTVFETDMENQKEMTTRVERILGDLHMFDAIVDQVRAVLEKRLTS